MSRRPAGEGIDIVEADEAAAEGADVVGLPHVTGLDLVLETAIHLLVVGVDEVLIDVAGDRLAAVTGKLRIAGEGNLVQAGLVERTGGDGPGADADDVI